MTDRPTRISDEEILAAWGGADGMSVERRSETTADLRQLIESPGDGCAMIGRIVCCFEGYKVDVGRLRDSLGGWDRVWRSVLVELGFGHLCEFVGVTWVKRVGDAPLSVQLVEGKVGRLLVGAWVIPLASPADLRERVTAAERLFRG